MAISISDLSPKYQRQAAEKILAAEQEKQDHRQRDSLSTVRGEPKNGGGGQRRKYHNQPDERITPGGNVVKFDSRKEAKRYDALMERLARGEIRNLRLQVDFTLQEAFTDAEGVRTHAIRYRADFTYEERWIPAGPSCKTDYNATAAEEWLLVVEDVKSRGTRTEKYNIKRKLMKEKYRIDIREV